MPTYDYRCEHCNHMFAAMHKISEAAPPCPNCGGSVNKILSAPALHGTGSKDTAAASAPAAHGCGAASCGCRH